MFRGAAVCKSAKFRYHRSPRLAEPPCVSMRVLDVWLKGLRYKFSADGPLETAEKLGNPRPHGRGSSTCSSPSAVLLRNAAPSLFHQRHIGRMLRSSCDFTGRRLASPCGRKPPAGRCPPLWPSDVRNDGGRVPAAGADGSQT